MPCLFDFCLSPQANDDGIASIGSVAESLWSGQMAPGEVERAMAISPSASWESRQFVEPLPYFSSFYSFYSFPLTTSLYNPSVVGSTTPSSKEKETNVEDTRRRKRLVQDEADPAHRDSARFEPRHVGALGKEQVLPSSLLSSSK